MIILGITPTGLNNAAALLVDGRLVAFAEEERFNRLKQSPFQYPKKAIEFCLNQANISANQVDITAIGFSAPERILQCDIDDYLQGNLSNHKQFEFCTSVSRLCGDIISPILGKRRYYDHHICHAASALFPSGFDKANVISLDGWGGDKSGCIGYFDGSTFKIKISFPPAMSWGMVYQAVTDRLGFMPHSGEGKTMGLAPYGQPQYDLLPDNLFQNDFFMPNYNDFIKYLDKFYPRNQYFAPMSEFGQTLAATVQARYERSLIAIARHLYETTGYKNYALAGGVALNCTGNGALARQSFVDNIFVQPAAHDGGTALGAAIIAYAEQTGLRPDCIFSHAYWGEGFGQDQIKKRLDSANIKYRECDPEEAVSESLLNNLVIGLFQGRSEVGPRALGNRSIIANPSYRSNHDRVNNIKRRENWRPLAPSVLDEHYNDVFEGPISSRYMTIATQVKQEWREMVPAITHIDGSARPQAVNFDANQLYHRCISKFYQKSGIPLVLNTSFNLDDEPIVNTPDQAIATFFRSGLDVLIIGNFIVSK